MMKTVQSITQLDLESPGSRSRTNAPPRSQALSFSPTRSSTNEVSQTLQLHPKRQRQSPQQPPESPSHPRARIQRALRRSQVRAKTEPTPRSNVRTLSANGRAETDVILAIKTLHLSRIINREKNHEFRKYRLKDGVERLWLYETAGDGKEGKGRAAITHIATTSPNVRYTPGQVPEIPPGIGNREFNAGLKNSKYAYPILSLYEIVPPISLEDMKTRWGLGCPMGWMYVKMDLWKAKWGASGPEQEAVVRLF